MTGDSDLNNNITPSVEILIQLVLYKDYRTSTLEYPKTKTQDLRSRINFDLYQVFTFKRHFWRMKAWHGKWGYRSTLQRIEIVTKRPRANTYSQASQISKKALKITLSETGTENSKGVRSLFLTLRRIH